MNYLSVSQTAKKWSMSARRVQILCNEGRIEGAQKVDSAWIIPQNAIKPTDARNKTNKKEVIINPNNICFERIWAMPNKNTFDIKPINSLIHEELTDGIWIDPFANKNKIATITNDLNPEYDTDYHLDAYDFMQLFDNNSIDGILYDPPYSPRQVSECYNDVGYNVTWDTTNASFWANHKKEISRIVKVGGKVITFGWNSGGIGKKYGFEITRILLVPHGGWHNDTICTVEIKTHEPDFNKQEILNNCIETEIKTDDQNLENDAKLVKLLQTLPANYWDFKDADVKEYTHGLHNYPAVMVSPISKNILSLMKKIKPINSLLDPFAGSGTVLVEGMVANINQIYGTDINPLALFLSQVKTTRLDVTILQNEAKNLFEKINHKYQDYFLQINSVNEVMCHDYHLDLTAKEGWGNQAHQYLNEYVIVNKLDIEVPNFKNIGYWFKPKVILLLAIIKQSINQVQDKTIRDFFYVAYSETIRLVSNRRNGEFKMFRMTPEKVASFDPDVLQEFTNILNRNILKMNAFNDVCDQVNCQSEVKIYQNNAILLNDIPDNNIDLVITSPPYGDSRTTVAYGEYSRLSLQLIDLFELEEKEIMGIDKSLMGGNKFKNGFEFRIPSPTLKEALDKIQAADLERAGDVYSFYWDLEQAIKTIAKKTTLNGYQFWVVGNRTVKGELLLTDQIIIEIASHYGMKHVHTIDRNILNKVMPSSNSPTNEVNKKVTTMTNEHIVVLRKTSF